MNILPYLFNLGITATEPPQDSATIAQKAAEAAKADSTKTEQVVDSSFMRTPEMEAYVGTDTTGKPLFTIVPGTFSDKFMDHYKLNKDSSATFTVPKWDSTEVNTPGAMENIAHILFNYMYPNHAPTIHENGPGYEHIQQLAHALALANEENIPNPHKLEIGTELYIPKELAVFFTLPNAAAREPEYQLTIADLEHTLEIVHDDMVFYRGQWKHAREQLEKEKNAWTIGGSAGLGSLTYDGTSMPTASIGFGATPKKGGVRLGLEGFVTLKQGEQPTTYTAHDSANGIFRSHTEQTDESKIHAYGLLASLGYDFENVGFGIEGGVGKFIQDYTTKVLEQDWIGTVGSSNTDTYSGQNNNVRGMIGANMNIAPFKNKNIKIEAHADKVLGVNNSYTVGGRVKVFR